MFIETLGREKRAKEYIRRYIRTENIECISDGGEYAEEAGDKEIMSVVHMKGARSIYSKEAMEELHAKLLIDCPGKFLGFHALSHTEKVGFAIAPVASIISVHRSQQGEKTDCTEIEHGDGYYRATESVEEIMAKIQE